MNESRDDRGSGERRGVAQLTRVAKVAPPVVSTGLMPPPVENRGKSATPQQRRKSQAPAVPAGAPLSAPVGVARLTPRSAKAEAAARELRQVMGRFATGVTVVSTTHRETVHAMTANAFMSVSLRPPLVLVSLGRSRMSEMLPRTGRYGISMLAAGQEELAAHFAGMRVAANAPEFVWEHGFPLLSGALAHVGCRVADIHAAGDHVLWIGEVEHLSHHDGQPLLFYAGRFSTLQELSDSTAGT
jgi:flavin reductase (DIM6/NTAB) family NADH-FMN oxidoreductase RutF